MCEAGNAGIRRTNLRWPHRQMVNEEFLAAYRLAKIGLTKTIGISPHQIA
jgi:hypothetical protein